MKNNVICLTCALAALFSARAAHAAVIMTLEQVGPDVVATGTGTADLTGLTFDGSFSNAGPFIAPDGAILLLEAGAGVEYDTYTGISGPSFFGGSDITKASTGTGYALGFDEVGNQIIVPYKYVSATPLSSTATWDNTTLAALGVTPGTYTYTWGSGLDADSLTLYAGVPVPTSVPEPAPALLLTLGAAALLLLRRRKK